MTIQGNHDQPDLALTHDEERDQYVLHVNDGLGRHHRVILDDATVEALANQARDLLDGKPKPQQPAMEVSIHRHRWANMGDHAILAQEAVKYDPTETVESLVLRVLDLTQPFGRHDPMDHLVLRVVEGTEPERKSSNHPDF